ncbi:hypothetical protein H2203_008879 [Taxawa tesnikishii (nom. ined.)]|nr:hypothetical protein H2203_008879 [Dothideales sp. JES 119]
MSNPPRSYASLFSSSSGPAQKNNAPSVPEENHIASQPSSQAQDNQPNTNDARHQRRPPQSRHHDQSPASHSHRPRRRSPSPAHIPRTDAPENYVYVLTLLTDPTHHQTLTSLRNRKLDSAIVPTLSEIASSTPKFPIRAADPFRLRKGIAIGVPKGKGGDQARDVHARLRKAWMEFLSEQDAGGFRAHYTIMNKVDDEVKVQKAYREVESEWVGCDGTVEGLSLFRYDRGYWVLERNFEFK